ncbi:hypothetical protein WICPIJ_005810 [Wickerhamomyces pijperi]|uniref:Bacterial surface antigen (D15) domain-containing protein n=1 Tax=Wickerhamomyces pijperi TaxID=599730 RepID=A0A9P8Q4Y6_WICPI|nr:hypothetical protein WICPIJ_005810 [Wickerhamomyces pijperi]
MSALNSALTEESKYQVLNSQLTRPLTISKLEFVGGDFNDKYYENLVKNILPQEAADKNAVLSLRAVNDELLSIENSLSNTGLFSKISIDLDVDESAVSPTLIKGESSTFSSSGSGLIPVKAKFNLTQLPLFRYSSYSSILDDGSSVGFRYSNPNFLRNSSSLLLDTNFHYDILSNRLNHKLLNLNILLPLPSQSKTKVIFNPTLATIDATKWASHEQVAAGALLGLQQTNVCPCSKAVTVLTAGVSFTDRKLTSIADSASDLIKASSGDDLKFAGQFNVKVDSRIYQDKFVKSGTLVSLTNEYAAFNGVSAFAEASKAKKNVPFLNFAKTVFDFSTTSSFLSDIFTTQLQFQAGHIVDFSKGKLHLTDKFFLGGDSTLKGFQLNSVGLKDGKDFVGGTSVWRLNLGLFSRLPNVPASSPLRIYSFFNVGDNYNFKSAAEASDLILSGAVLNSASAVGTGIVYKANNAVLDLSYNVPLSVRGQDSAKPGFSLNASLNFF